MKFFLGRSLYNITVDREVPAEVPMSLLVPGEVGSWYPSMLINGTDYYGYIQQIPFSFSRLVISTNYHPIYDARLGRSNWTMDEHKIMQIKNFLNNYGFDCSTIGKGIQPFDLEGKEFLNLEKEWASGGDCFISILTPRDLTMDGRLALPPPWVVTESGLSYDSERPQLVFVEEGVDRVALYGKIDNAHVIQFSVVHEVVYLEPNFSEKVRRFRSECQSSQTNKKMEGIGYIIFLGFALYGGYKFFEGLS
jgi:hypothetical protein